MHLYPFSMAHLPLRASPRKETRPGTDPETQKPDLNRKNTKVHMNQHVKTTYARKSSERNSEAAVFFYSRMTRTVRLSEACSPIWLNGAFKSLYRKYTETSAQRVRCPTHALHRCPLRWQHSFVCSSTHHRSDSLPC